jgi:hypothetical protein
MFNATNEIAVHFELQNSLLSPRFHALHDKFEHVHALDTPGSTLIALKSKDFKCYNTIMKNSFI